jgi:hypothetical protein
MDTKPAERWAGRRDQMGTADTLELFEHTGPGHWIQRPHRYLSYPFVEFLQHPPLIPAGRARFQVSAEFSRKHTVRRG